jgi:coenzyme F420-0:L-glutamate ligase
VQLYAIKSKLILPGDSVAARFVEALSVARLRVKNGDILAIASKVVSLSEKNIVSLGNVKPTVLARRLGRRFDMHPAFAQVVVNESDAMYGGVPGVLLTLKNGNATANSGVDRKNAPGDSVIPWPVNPQRSADGIRRSVLQKLRKRVGVVIVDSRVTPLRLGTTGLAIACSGFQPVRDSRGIRDLYGRKARITFHAVADGIAGAAQLLMGETRETVPFVVVRRAPVELSSRKGSGSMTLPVKDCLYMSQMPPPRFFPSRNRPLSAPISNLNKHMKIQGNTHAENVKNPRPNQAQTMLPSA